VYPLGDYELASRLSFFLWSSIPDDALLDAAAKGALKNDQELTRQVRRMIADQRSEALARNFAGQWLYLRTIEGSLPTRPGFGENPRRIHARRALLHSIVAEPQLLDSDRRRHVRQRGSPAIRHP
jgi:hypothetical protein